MRKLLVGVALSASLYACSSKEEVDLVVHNGVVYTVDSAFSVAEAFAVKDGKFVAIGSSEEILDKYQPKHKLDARQKSIYPGFYDAHAHFWGLAEQLSQCDLVGTHSFEEMMSYLRAYRGKHLDKKWIIGRGWDQNDWEVKVFPNKDQLDKEFPDVPVYLVRVDGHAALANSAALAAAGITPDTKVSGGVVELKNGQLTGILIDNAMGLVEKVIPQPSDDEMSSLLQAAERACLSHGLTTVADAGLTLRQIGLIDKMQKEGKLKIRLYAMAALNEENKAHYLRSGPYKTDRLNVRSFKIYADGALGSRGACLLEPYADQPNTRGFLLISPEELKKHLTDLAVSQFQANTHCIGDSANRLVLNMYGQLLKGKNDRRWRIEHAQVVHPDDLPKFGQYSVIPSVQPTHATSDMMWADERLGDRVRYAYAFNDLLKQTGKVAIGSDFPVENVNPIFGFHAAVARQNGDHEPENGFQVENALTKENALRGMTIWAAYANFEEKERGSIEANKQADFVILNTDLIETHPRLMRLTLVLDTYIAGEKVYNSKKANQ
jgi:predicted amidohydrolase YtcJ